MRDCQSRYRLHYGLLHQVNGPKRNSAALILDCSPLGLHSNQQADVEDFLSSHLPSVLQYLSTEPRFDLKDCHEQEHHPPLLLPLFSPILVLTAFSSFLSHQSQGAYRRLPSFASTLPSIASFLSLWSVGLPLRSAYFLFEHSILLMQISSTQSKLRSYLRRLILADETAM